MKIALVYDLAYPFSIGGVESRNMQLAGYLASKGHEVHLFSVKMWPGKDTLDVAKNIKLHGVSRYPGKKFSGNRKPFEVLKYSIKLFHELKRYNFDVIDVSSFPYLPAFACKRYSMLKNAKLIMTWHEVWQDYWKAYGLTGIPGRIIEKLAAKLTKNNIAVSEMTANKLRRLGQKNIKVIDDWIDLEEISQAKKLKQEYDIIAAGRHLKHKNFALMLKAIALLKKDFPKMKALMLGEGPETINLLKMRNALDLEENIDMLTFTKDKDLYYSYLKSGKIFMQLSELEGFSIAAFEAMASGLPIITIDSERNALKTYIDGKNGLVCRKDAIDIALKTKPLLKNKDKLREMSLYSMDFSKAFDIKKKAKEIEACYK